MASVLSAGTTSNTALNLSADTTGILQFQTNGTTAAMTLDTSQNVGIGTTSPNALLTIAAASTDTRIRLVGRSADGTSAIRYYSADNATQYGFLSFGNAYAEFNYNGSGYMGFATNNTERMRITSGGLVGIGETTPNNTLAIKAAAATVRLDSSTGTNAVYSQFVNTAGSFYVGRDASNGGIFGTAYASVLYSEGAYPMNFYTGGSERMRITSAGDVGISTTSPTHKLQVNGAGRFGSQTTGPGLLDGSSDNFRVGLNQDNTNTSNTQIWAEYTTGASVASWAVRYRAANDTGTAATRMLINTSGDVGIGSISPSSRLHVDGGSGMSSSGVIARFFGTSGNSLLIRGNGNAENTNGSYGAISDAKLKENIVDATPKLDKVIQLKVRNYNLIGDNLKQIGFVAQEIEQVFPSIVSEIPDLNEEGNDLGTTTKTVKTSVLIPILVKAIQELKAELDATKAEVAALKGVK